MQLSKLLTYINQALNYPSLSYEDLDLFLDQAISELNTTLHISIPSVSKMKDDFRQYLSKQLDGKRVLIPANQDPTSSSVSITGYDDEDSVPAGTKYFYNREKGLFGILDVATSSYEYYKTIYGTYMRNGMPEVYQSWIFASGQDPIWEAYTANEEDFDLVNYLPDDWVMLWLIPYACYKYTVRDGGTAQTFAEELTQGFQQLQETYDVPSTVALATVADKYAYHGLAEEFINNLNVKVRTLAIYESMKHSRNTNAIFGSMYDRGGFL